jgi:F-type H+-transporting ATPase subunit b
VCGRSWRNWRAEGAREVTMLIDWFTVAAQAVNFLILVWLLKRFLYKPVLAAIDEREKRIATLIQDAEKKKAEAVKEQTDFLHKSEEFERQRAGLLLEATNSGKTERDKLLEKARTDSEELRSKLKKTVHDELDNLQSRRSPPVSPRSSDCPALGLRN